ncbi:hypothetical protein [Ruminococcus flavefaciens]|uniref:Uncharacterized protein n=1 Tax=Ruminococcus flavefaciens TaxID=1265 RepID=A0A1M7G1I6_RUMFL|nr:hypothetical protein [Ruminococcus flavefaciens]SHM10076.1 hypothetical protein SAMN04487860_1013 [Ruminococcus flavefaciens]
MRPNEYDDLLKKIKCSDDFRKRMQEKLSSEPVMITETEYADSVSGTDVAPQRNWGRFAAIAAAFVLVGGAVGGGAYYFNKMKNDKPVVNEENESESIYEKVKANKDIFDMDEYVWNYSAGANVLVKESSNYRLFDFLDGIEGVKKVDDCPNAFRSVRFSFSDSKSEKHYDFSLRENGYGFWQETDENGNGVYSAQNKECYYYGKDVFEKLFDKMLRDVDSETVEAMCKTSGDEILSFVSRHLENSDNSVIAYPWLGYNESEVSEYSITDKEALTNSLMQFEWVKIKESEFEYNNCYDIGDKGIRVSEWGYLMAVEDDPDPYGCYKLKNEIEKEKLVDAVKSVLGYDAESRDATSEEIREVLKPVIDEPKATTWDGTKGIPQGGQYYGTIYRYYNVNEPESFINELASFEWVTCLRTEAENNVYIDTDNLDYTTVCQIWDLASSYSISENGYLCENTGYDSKLRCYKLKNERDKDKIRPIVDKYITMTEGSQLAEKLRMGIDNYDNLEADFVCDGNDGRSGDCSLRGHLYYDAKNHKMYMNGEGTFDGKEVTIETIMNGEDHSAYRVIDKATGEVYRSYVYCITSPMIPRSPAHYVYASKGIEQMLGPVWAGDPEYNIESRDIGGGKTEYNISGRQGEGYDEINKTIVLTEGGQLISSESNGYSFRLENYVFNSDSFEMVDISKIFEEINYEDNKRDYQLPENSLYPELIGSITSDMDIQVIRDNYTKNLHGYNILELFKGLDKDGGDEDFWLLHGSEFKSGSKHGDRHMNGYCTIIIETEKYEFVIYVPDDESKNKPEWGDNSVLIEKHYGTENESHDSYYRDFSDSDLNTLRQIIINGY